MGHARRGGRGLAPHSLLESAEVIAIENAASVQAMLESLKRLLPVIEY
jgi:hypothetical protein